MMQLGNAFQGKSWARCWQAIESDLALVDDRWYHRAWLAEGTECYHAPKNSPRT